MNAPFLHFQKKILFSWNPLKNEEARGICNCIWMDDGQKSEMLKKLNSRNNDKMEIPKSTVTLEYCISLIQGGPKHPDNFSNLHNSSLNFQDTDFSFSFILCNSTVLFTYIENFFSPSGLNIKLQGFRYSTENENLFKLIPGRICGFIWTFQI